MVELSIKQCSDDTRRLRLFLQHGTMDESTIYLVGEIDNGNQVSILRIKQDGTLVRCTGISERCGLKLDSSDRIVETY